MGGGNILWEIISWLLGLLDHCFALTKLLGGNNRPTQFFRKGYGDLSVYEKAFEKSLQAIETGTYKFELTDQDIEWSKEEEIDVGGDVLITKQKGSFTSPVATSLPKEASQCYFQLIRPKQQRNNKNYKDNEVYIMMLPATGEQGSSTRLNMAKSLAKEYGWNSVIVTAPYYANRKPSTQTMFFLNTVNDILCQALGIIEESAVLAKYFQQRLRGRGHEDKTSNIIFTGFSFGGAMASCSASLALGIGVSGEHIGIASYVGSASPVVLADGILEYGIDWNALSLSQSNAKESTATSYDTTRMSLRDKLNETQLDIITSAVNKKSSSSSSSSSSSASSSNNTSNKIRTIHTMSMNHDVFIRKRYGLELEHQLLHLALPLEKQQSKSTASPSRDGDAVTAPKSYVTSTWLPGGHVLGAIIRPYYHKQLITETTKELLGIDEQIS